MQMAIQILNAAFTKKINKKHNYLTEEHGQEPGKFFPLINPFSLGYYFPNFIAQQPKIE